MCIINHSKVISGIGVINFVAENTFTSRRPATFNSEFLQETAKED